MRQDEPFRCKLMIRGAAALTMDEAAPYLPCADIGVDGGAITYLAPHDPKLCFAAEETIDASALVALPGFVNAHSHIGMSYQRGLADDMRLFDFLERTFPVQRLASEEDVFTFALVACAELLHSGCTGVCDIMEKLPATVRAVALSGLRAKLSPNIVDFNVPGRAAALVAQNCSDYERFNGASDGRITIDFNLHAPYSCTEALILGIADAAEKRGADLHIHLSENLEETNDIQQRFQLTPTAYFNRLGVLGPNVLAAHFVHVTPADIEIAADRGLRIAHCPASNLKLASGFAPVPEMLENGLCVGLGTDSCVTNNSFSMFETMKLTALIHKATHADATLLPARQVLRLATAAGAAAAGFPAGTGVLAPGKRADLSLLRLRGRVGSLPYLPDLPDTLISHIVYAGSPDMVETVIADGVVLMRNKTVCAFDEDALAEEANGRARALLHQAGVI